MGVEGWGICDHPHPAPHVQHEHGLSHGRGWVGRHRGDYRPETMVPGHCNILPRVLYFRICFGANCSNKQLSLKSGYPPW